MRDYKSLILSEASHGGLPAAYWPLDEAAGTTAADLMTVAAGTGYDGTYTVSGIDLAYAPGPVARSSSRAIRLDGSVGEFVTLPASSAIVGAATAATWEAWVHADAMTSDQRITGTFSAGNSQFALLLGRSSGRFSVFGRSAANALVQLNSASTYAAGVWRHIVATITGSTLALYVDGALAGSTTASASNTLSANTDGARIGSDGGGSGRLAGLLAHVAFYRYALAADRIKARYLSGINGVPTSGLLTI